MTNIVGVVLVVLGLTLAGATVLQLDRGGGAPGATPAQSSETSLLSVALPLAAAVVFASGIVLLVVGMGRWNRPRTHSEPGDAIVDPESHHKMDHV
jgi:hypothetical protein